MYTKNDIRPLLKTAFDQVATQASNRLMSTAKEDRNDRPAGTPKSHNVCDFLDELALQLLKIQVVMPLLFN